MFETLNFCRKKYKANKYLSLVFDKKRLKIKLKWKESIKDNVEDKYEFFCERRPNNAVESKVLQGLQGKILNLFKGVRGFDIGKKC